MSVSRAFFRYLAVFSLLFAVVSLSHGHTQSSDQSDDATLILPEIDVTSGPLDYRKGLRAFYDGDFVLAEKHFRRFRNQVEGGAVSIGPLGSTNGQFSGAEGTVGVVGRNLNAAGHPTRILKRGRISNAQVGEQAQQYSYSVALYWVGMSQIRQGKYDDAEHVLTRALGYNKSLHDARLRRGLLRLLDGDRAGAQRDLEEFERWCSSLSCEENDELGLSYRTLKTALDQAAGS